MTEPLPLECYHSDYAVNPKLKLSPFYIHYEVLLFKYGLIVAAKAGLVRISKWIFVVGEVLDQSD